MRNENVPVVDARYWAAIVVASVLGTAFGDFNSNTLELGFGGAALTVGTVLAVIFIAERVLPWPSVAWYWGAVIFTRTAATDLGDFLSRTADLGNGPVSAILAGCLAIYLLVIWRVYGPGPLNGDVPGAPKRLPRTNVRYWATMLAISTLGTTLGDFVSDEMGLGLALGSLFLGLLLAAALIVETGAQKSNEMRYWGVIILVRTACTDFADFMTEPEGLDLGFAMGAALVFGVLLVILLARRETKAVVALSEN